MPGGNVSWFKLHTSPIALYHDQEPLQFDFYTEQMLENYFIHLSNGILSRGDKFLEQKLKANLRGHNLYNAHDLEILCHSEKNSAELIKYENKNFIGVYYWSHALISRDWFRYAEHDNMLSDCLQGPLFLVYNRAWSGTREYRLKFTEMIIDQQLHNDCLMTFTAEDSGSYKSHCFKNTSLKIQRQDLEQYFDKNTSLANSSADYSTKDYARTKIEVVLETLFDDSRHHLTEKILRPIACGKPFILAATPGSLQYLRDYGFETFSPWFDETYDTISDPLDRLNAIVAEMNRLKHLPLDQQQQMFQAVQEISQRNKALFFSSGWIKQIVEEYQKNFNAAMNHVKSSVNGTFYKELGKIAESIDSPISKVYNQARPGLRTEEEIQQFLDLINKS